MTFTDYLLHKWIDSTVVNGQRYFYLITSYDRGSDIDMVPPSECNYKLLLNPVTGDVESKSTNVAVVTPNPPSTGYVQAESDVPIEHIAGFTNSSLGIEVLNSPAVKDNNTYQITFNDTVKGYGASSVLVTKSLTLTNKTSGDTLLLNSEKIHTGDEIPVTEGFRLVLQNVDTLEIDTSKTKFNRDGIHTPVFSPFFYRGAGTIKQNISQKIGN
jgi:hypothetical protein